MKRILIGSAGSGKTHQILDEFEAHLRVSDPLAQDSFFLLPSAEHTDRIITLLLQRGIKGFFFRRITTLSSLLSQVFPAGDSLFISSASRFMIFREIFETRSWDYFAAVQKTPGFWANDGPGASRYACAARAGSIDCAQWAFCAGRSSRADPFLL